MSIRGLCVLILLFTCLLFTGNQNLVWAGDAESESKSEWLTKAEYDWLKTHPEIYLAPVGFGLILSLLLWWNRSLKRQVKARTEELKQELSERKRAEEALRDSENKMRSNFRVARTHLKKISNLSAKKNMARLPKVEQEWSKLAGKKRMNRF